jgi:hypothetical protein
VIQEEEIEEEKAKAKKLREARRYEEEVKVQ